MKKLFSVLAAATVLVLTACGSTTTPDDGIINDDMYINESIGLQFQLPLHWGFSDEGEDIHDLFAINYLTGSTAQVMFHRLSFFERRNSVPELLEEFLDGIIEGLGSVNRRVINSGTTRVGDYDFHSGLLSFDLMGLELDLTAFLRVENGYGIVVTIGVIPGLGDNLDGVLGFFQSPGAPRIYVPEPGFATEADMIGTWLWNVDESYTLTFNADGTGIRGFSTMPEVFTWEVIDGFLFIDLEDISKFGAINEEWLATIDDDVLLIENLYPGGAELIFSYTRQ